MCKVVQGCQTECRSFQGWAEGAGAGVEFKGMLGDRWGRVLLTQQKPSADIILLFLLCSSDWNPPKAVTLVQPISVQTSYSGRVWEQRMAVELVCKFIRQNISWLWAVSDIWLVWLFEKKCNYYKPISNYFTLFTFYSHFLILTGICALKKQFTENLKAKKAEILLALRLSEM